LTLAHGAQRSAFCAVTPVPQPRHFFTGFATRTVSPIPNACELRVEYDGMTIPTMIVLENEIIGPIGFVHFSVPVLHIEHQGKHQATNQPANDDVLHVPILDKKTDRD
jgi:hypothetical protein